MTNKEFIKKLEYEERVMRELHGVKVAMPFKAALEAARVVVEGMKYDAPIDEEGRDGWHVGR